jgi:hypothetical protein
MFRRSTALFAALILGWIGSTAFAGSLIRDFLDGPSVLIRGQYLGTSDHGVNPFVVQVYAGRGECLRLQVTRVSSGNLEMGVFSPDIEERHYVDDNSGGGTFPSIIIDPTPVHGWYIVAVSEFVGAAVDIDFDISYGRHTSGSSVCQPVTPPSPASSPFTSPEEAS